MKPLCLILVLALSLPACSRFSESARRQRAYEKYVRKSMANRTRQESRISRSRRPKMLPVEVGPVTETITTESPPAAPMEQAGQ